MGARRSVDTGIDTHRSRRMGSTELAFSLNTLAFASPLSCARTTIASSVFRRGEDVKSLSITSYESDEIVTAVLRRRIHAYNEFTTNAI